MELQYDQEVTFKNMNFDGEDRKKNDSGSIYSRFKGGTLKIENSEFKNLTYDENEYESKPPIGVDGQDGTLIVNETKIHDNDIYRDYLIDVRTEDISVDIKNSSIQDNKLGAAGAIFVGKLLGLKSNKVEGAVTGDNSIKMSNLLVKNNTNGNMGYKVSPE